jgi:glutamate-5-semialdehyde dehydrogenase
MFNEIGINAQKASKVIARLSTEEKNTVLYDMSQELINNKDSILTSNKLDLENSKELNLSTALIDRLTLNEERILGMSNGLRKIIPLPDPVGEITKEWMSDDGLSISKVRNPFGVIGVIYEARPNVTSDVSGLCLKSGNAVILRGSSYCLDSNKAILQSLQNALQKNNLDKNIVQLIDSKDREDTLKFMQMTDYIDLIVPRGGRSLINALVENAKVPFILDGDGNVHLYVHSDAKRSDIINIILNSKVQRPGVCNALETLIIHDDIYKEMGEEIIQSLLDADVELFLDKKIVSNHGKIEEATDLHYETEFHDLKLAIKVVDDLNDAINHINLFSSGHTESILTESDEAAELFTSSIDSSVLFVNASTRFTDGEMFGFGAEIGISTQKLHVRGPMGLEALTSEKYVVKGNGTIRK